MKYSTSSLSPMRNEMKHLVSFERREVAKCQLCFQLAGQQITEVHKSVKIVFAVVAAIAAACLVLMACVPEEDEMTKEAIIIHLKLR